MKMHNNNYYYKIWKKILAKKITIESIIHELMIGKLLTTSGANLVNDLMSINRNTNQPKYIICNAEEVEPGTFKERDLLLNYPEKLLEGIAIVGFIIGAQVGYIYVKDSFVEAFNLIEKSIKYAYQERLLGKNLLNLEISSEFSSEFSSEISSEFSFDIYPLYGAGSYIVGDASAMLGSIEGKKAFPRIKPLSPQVDGLYGCPTVVVNAETLVNIPDIIEHGGDWYCNLSNTKLAGGKKIFSISGHVTKPGNYELPLSSPFVELLNMAGGVKFGNKLKAVLPGGLTSPILPAEVINNLNLDHASLKKVGSTLGSGGIIIMDNTTCMVEILCRISRFFMEGSCGQCTPCREGTGWLYKIIARILIGNGTLEDLQTLDKVAENIYGKNLCPLGDNAALSVKSFMKYFREEFIQKIKVRSKINAQVSN